MNTLDYTDLLEQLSQGEQDVTFMGSDTLATMMGLLVDVVLETETMQLIMDGKTVNGAETTATGFYQAPEPQA